jgi:hypothetical protein
MNFSFGDVIRSQGSSLSPTQTVERKKFDVRVVLSKILISDLFPGEKLLGFHANSRSFYQCHW